MDKKLLKEEYKRLLTKAIEGRPGGMALMIVLEETDFYNSPRQRKASPERPRWPAATLAQRSEGCTGTVREYAAVCRVR